MLKLGEAGQIERAREAMRNVEAHIREVIGSKPLIVEFDQLEIFGTPEETKVVYGKVKEDSEDYERIKEINGIIIQAMIDNKVIERKDLSHISLNRGRYEADKLHMTVMNSSFAMRDLLKQNTRTFNSTLILEKHPLKLESAIPSTIEISTRF